MNGADGWSIDHGSIESPDLLLLADHIQYNPATGQVAAEGHIRLESQNLRLRCERLSMDWKHRVGEAWALELELPPNWTLTSDHAAFATLQHWDFQKVTATSCTQGKPGWATTFSQLKVDLKGFAVFRDAKLYVGPVPTMYLPWGVYPAKADRSAGLLPTFPSYSSTFGLSLAVPYFQPLGDTMDFTLDPVFHAKENPLWAGEMRWNPEPTHTGSFTGQYIHQRTDDETRYRYQFKELWQREDGWQVNADLNRTSDSLMEADYGRHQDAENLGFFDSNVYVGKSFPLASLSFHAAEQRNFFSTKDDPFYSLSFPESVRKQTLPEVQSRMYPIALGSTFYLDAGVKVSRLVYKLEFDGKPTSSYAWNRGDFFTKVQGQLGQWGPFRADLQALARFTYYDASLRGPLYDPDTAVSGTALSPTVSPFLVDGNAIERTMGSAKLQLAAPPVGRTYDNVHLFGYRGELKHVLEPFVGLTTNTRSGVEAYVPRFDDVDSKPGVDGSAMGEESVEVGVTQHFMGRRRAGDGFTEFARWKLSTKYYDRPILLSDGTFKQGWGSLDNSLDVEPNDRLRVTVRTSYDLTENLTDRSLTFDWKAAGQDQYSFAIFSMGTNRFQVKQQGIQLSGLKRLLDDTCRLEFRMNYDYHKIVSSEAAVTFLTSCVATSVRYSHLSLNTTSALSKEDRVDFVVTLRNLGDFKLFSR
ncbi:MAG TPA: putative LPS assembly protein LptD [Holophaga sp.]|nr:putative LPS assembly protein LptD [Holophaga sp.]